jgi:hypothetical protein
MRYNVPAGASGSPGGAVKIQAATIEDRVRQVGGIICGIERHECRALRAIGGTAVEGFATGKIAQQVRRQDHFACSAPAIQHGLHLHGAQNFQNLFSGH